MWRRSSLKLEVQPRLVDAGADFLYLLERGYGRKAALDLVTARWGLSKLERLALYRCVFDSRTSARRLAKLVLHAPRLAVDGFNVLTTIQSALAGDTLIATTDGFVRDLSATLRRVEVGPLLLTSLVLMLSYLSRLSAREVVVVLDAQVSRSGELARAARSLMPSYVAEGDAVTSNRTDSFLASLGDRYCVTTSDSVLVDRVNTVLDLGGALSALIAEDSVINLGALIITRVKGVAEDLSKRVGAHDEEAGDESAGDQLR